MKRRILMVITLMLMLVLGLSGCTKKPRGTYLVVSAPDTVVFSDAFDDSTLKVYRFYDKPIDKAGNRMELLTKGQFTLNEEDVPGAAGIKKVIISAPASGDKKEKTILEASFNVVKTSAASRPIEEEESFLVFQFQGVTEDPKKPTQYIFTHQLGYTFNKDNFNSEYIKVIKVGPSADGTETIQTDVTEEVAASIAEKTFEPQYKEDEYKIELTSGTTKGSFNVIVAGGEKPIHSKSANWFDYILVIPMGWLMQLFSFGGLYGLGIFITTIVVRSLAWPIYAKTNSMSARMSEAQPDLQRIQAKYRGRTDKASQQQMQMETMQIYKKHKIGMGSMFLPFLQMPIFMAMYQTVRRILIPGGYWATKIHNTKFLGIELSIGNHWTSYILAAIVGITMILLQWISQKKPAHLKKTTEHNKKGDDQAAKTNKTMKIFSYVMVAMMVIFSFQNNALALYWIIGNLFSLGQTILHRELNRRKYEKKQEETLGGIL